MSRNYDFTSLSWIEFEQLSCELMSLRISQENGNSVFFNRFKEGADKGIDGLYVDNGKRIVLQIKKFRNFSDLKHKLKRIELVSAKRLKPERYILITSLGLTPSQAEEIFTLFKPYILSSNDIIGRDVLNDMLNQFPKVELNYPKLYLPSIGVLEHIIHRQLNDQSKLKIESLKSIAKYFVKDENFDKALLILAKLRFLIISGEPGIGKSTLGGMLSLHFIKTESSNFIFIRGSISEAENMWESDLPQVFLFDDFLGSITFHDFDRNEDRQLLDFIHRIIRSKNKYLIVTTREYIFKYAENKYRELKELDFSKCILQQKQQTPEFKAKILENYLYYSNCSYDDLKTILYEDNFETLIKHRNFIPRIISEHLLKYREQIGKKHLFYELKKDLDDPFVYWRDHFLELPNSAQILLLALAISNEPISYVFLLSIFKNIGTHRKIYEFGYEKDTFNNALNELSDSFISISQNPIYIPDNYKDSISLKDYSLIFEPFRDSKMIEFQNPSIKDFTLNYLRNETHLIEILLKSCVIFNQLFFVFTTDITDEFIDDDESDYGFYAKKIVLNSDLLNIVKIKILKEFDQLPIIGIEKIYWDNNDVSYHLKKEDEDNRLLKLKYLTHYFNLSEDKDIREFVINKYVSYMEDHVSNKVVLSHAERLEQPNLIKTLAPYIAFNSMQIITDYYNDICMADEFLSFSDFEDIFQEEYKKFIAKTGKREINNKIKEIIYDNVDYFMSEGTLHEERALDDLLDITIPFLKDTFGVKLSLKFKKEINEMSGRNLFRITKNSGYSERQEIKPNKENDSEENNSERTSVIFNRIPSSTETVIIAIKQNLLPHNEEFDNEDDIRLYIENEVDSVTAEILESIFLESSPFYHDKYDPSVIDMLIKFSKNLNKIPEEKEILIKYILENADLREEQKQKCLTLAFKAFEQSILFFKESHANELLGTSIVLKDITDFLNKLEENSILVKNNNWYRFSTSCLRDNLVVEYVLKLPIDERLEFYNLICEYNYSGEDWFYLWSKFSASDDENFSAAFWLPELKQKSILFEANTPIGICRNFLVQLDLEISLSLIENELEAQSWSLSMTTFEDICSFLRIPLNSDDIIIFFTGNKFEKSKVLNYLIKNCRKGKEEFTINFARESNNKEFLKLIGNIGLKKYILTGIEQLQNKIKEKLT